jgi:hypothetical protein
VDAYIKEHKVECEWTPRKTFDACLTEEFSEYSAKALAGVREAGSTEEVEVLSGQEAKSVGVFMTYTAARLTCSGHPS